MLANFLFRVFLITIICNRLGNVEELYLVPELDTGEAIILRKDDAFVLFHLLFVIKLQRADKVLIRRIKRVTSLPEFYTLAIIRAMIDVDLAILIVCSRQANVFLVSRHARQAFLVFRAKESLVYRIDRVIS